MISAGFIGRLGSRSRSIGFRIEQCPTIAAFQDCHVVCDMEHDLNETDKFVTGFDSYNLCLTGSIGRTLSTPSGGLNEHIPVVVLGEEKADG